MSFPAAGRVTRIMLGRDTVRGPVWIVTVSSLLVLGVAGLVGSIACATLTRPLGPGVCLGSDPTMEVRDAGFHTDRPGRPAVAAGRVA